MNPETVDVVDEPRTDSGRQDCWTVRFRPAHCSTLSRHSLWRRKRHGHERDEGFDEVPACRHATLNRMCALKIKYSHKYRPRRLTPSRPEYSSPRSESVTTAGTDS